MSPAAFHLAILRSAAVLVPETQRADWLAEWRSELWHVRRDPGGQNVTAFCMGAFKDAFWLRREDPCPDRQRFFVESPARCLSLLAALGALCFAAALLLPAARTVLLGSLYPRDLVMLSPAEWGDPSVQNGLIDPYPSVSRAQFESLKAVSGGQFTALAFQAPDALPIEEDAALSRLSPYTRGFVVGRLRYGELRDTRFRFVRLRDRSLDLFGAALTIFLFACILVAALTSHFRGGHLRRIGPRRGLFLAAKALLVLPIVMFASLDLGSLGGSLSPLFFEVALLGSLFAARWILADQRKRCPVCLRLLANPVRIGESSRILLEWHGTELMCPRGHGLLYVPEWPAIWSPRQRWMDLGPTWEGL